MTSSPVAAISAIMLGVRDLDKSIEFYHGKLGLKIKIREPQLAMLEAGPVMLGLSPGHLRLAPDVKGATEVVFRVENVRAAREELSTAGVTFMNEPRQVTPTEWVAHFRDPDDHLLSIFGPEGKS